MEMSGLRVLITNNTLNHRAGTELYVRDVACALLKRGYEPVAYSTELGEIADEIRSAGVRVVEDLDQVETSPDIIHGHHHLETMTALLRFPAVPAVYFCHGWTPWEESPLRFPRITRYVAVDEPSRERLLNEGGIGADRITLLHNFVDLERFKSRGSLPESPRRALVFSNAANDYSYAGVIREACSKSGIEVDVIGQSSGNATAHPELLLRDYDLVFAKARSALEAIATGTAVILCDAVGAGPMVTPGDLDRLRSLNFGFRTLTQPLDPVVIAHEIGRYDPAVAAEASRRIREIAGMDEAIDEIIGIYRNAVSDYSPGKQDGCEEARAAAAYLQRLSPRLRSLYSVEFELATTSKSLALLQAEADGLCNMGLARVESEYQQPVSLYDRLRRLRDRITHLEIKEDQLEQITGTKGWRLLDRWGRFKHRQLLPFLRRFRRIQ